jgi:hypothetical protein
MNKITIATAIAALAVCAAAPPAHAEMSCQDFMRAYRLGDADVMGEAGRIIRPYIDANLEMLARKNPSAPPPPPLLNLLFVGQIAEDCESLPNDTVDRIVSTRVKAMQQLNLAIDKMKAAEPTRRPVPGSDAAVLAAAISDHTWQCWPGGHYVSTSMRSAAC